MLTVTQHVQMAVQENGSAWFHRDQVESLIRDYVHNHFTSIDQLENTPVLISGFEDDADRHLGAKL